MNPLVRLLPSFLVRTFAKPYIAGGTLKAGIGVAELLITQNKLATLDLLGEGDSTPQELDRTLAIFEKTLKSLASTFNSSANRPTFSIKPSSLCEAANPKNMSKEIAKLTHRRLDSLIKRSVDYGVKISIDMEDHLWTDFTLNKIKEYSQSTPTGHVGAVLQTRLHRSLKDIENLPAGTRTRLVIGIYNESAKIALTNKNDMKEQMLKFAELLFEKGHYVEFATHDHRLIQRFIDEIVKPQNIANERFEIQMLYGVPRDALQKQLIKQGIKVRLYVPFAVDWPSAIAYLRRRLDEYPQMSVMVIKNYVQALFGN